MKKTILTPFFLLLAVLLFAQTPAKYWVQFTYKDIGNYSIQKPEQFLSPRAIEKRAQFNIPITEEDIPVSWKQISTILLLDSTAVLVTTSKWHNGATFYSENPDFMTLAQTCDFVRYVEQTYTCKEPETFSSENVTFFNNNSPKSNISNDLDYGYGEKQLRLNNAHWLHRIGYKGEGVLMQVQDGGFRNSDSIRHFSLHFADNRVRCVKNFVQPQKSTFRDGSHGTGVWSCIAAYVPGELIGSAPACNFYLVQTEDTNSEYVIEEDYWVSGIEFADSLGIDIITSSLGYTSFDDSTYYRGHNSLDGKTSRATLAADIAALKGMIVINSAGNSGRDKWHYISPPADAIHTITVGAVNSIGNKANFSSFGPTYDGRVKPDAAAVGSATVVALPNNLSLPGSGTSYSAPLLAGMVACIKQAFPYKTNLEIVDAVRKGGAQYATPDSALGYGITDFLKVYNLLLQPENKNLNITFSTFVISNDSKTISFTIETKKDTKVTLSYGLRKTGKVKTKEFNLRTGANTIKLPVAKLPKSRKYDIWDLKILEGGSGERFVLGREGEN